MFKLLRPLFLTYTLPLALLLLPATFSAAQTPVINEVLPSNHTVNMDPDEYAFSDWIELYNPSSGTCDLSRLWLSNDRHKLRRWRFPYGATLAPGNYLVMWADSLFFSEEAFHLNFKLAKEGGTVYLSDNEGRLLDSLTWPSLPPDISYGYPSGSNALQYFPQPTPGSTNTTTPVPWLRPSRTPQISLPGGFYDHPVQVVLYSDDRDAVIRYTLDGSEPTEHSSLYTGPLTLSATTVVRATATENGKLKSKPLTQTYFINEDISLPVVSISMEPKYFWDDSVGFYVEGTNGLTGWQTGHGPSPKSNFNMDWKRPMHIEFYDEAHQPGFSADGEVKVYGGWTRGAVIKSLAVYTYSPINYKLFPERSFTRYESFIIRNGGNEWARTKLRDAVLQSLAINETDVDLQANRPAVLFINGEFWGVMNIRDKINADYIKTVHGVDQDSIDYIESYRTVKAGDMEHLQMMNEFLATHDLSNPADYYRFKRMVDVKECLNYFMTGIYSGHGDWIYNNNNNLRLWRPRTDDGRWRWLLYDTDGAFGSTTARGIADAVNRSTILAALLKNEEARTYFINKFTALLNSSFAPERALHMIDSLKGLLAHDMPRHIEKWKDTDDEGNPAAWKTPGSGEYIQSEDGYGGPCLSSYAQWEGYFSWMRSVAAVRSANLLKELGTYFGLGETHHITLTTSPREGGIVEVNGVLQRDYGHSTTWYDGQQLTIRAVPRYGYRFAGWYKGGLQYTSLLPSGAVWRYLDDGSDQGTAWRDPSFDDALWKSGAAQLGYGDGDETTVVSYGPDAGNKYITTYFRTSFEVEDPAVAEVLVLEMQYDDGAIVWLNGTEVVRANMADGTITSRTAALSAIGGEAENMFTTFTLPAGVLREGSNVVAVEIHQVSPVSTDISFDLRIMAGEYSHSDTLYSDAASLTHTVRGDLQLVAVFDSSGATNRLRFNEIVARNHSYSSYAAGITSDWIELYNDGDEAVPLEGLYITTDIDNPRMCEVRVVPGTVVAPHGYTLLWADGSEKPHDGHLTFKLKGQGGTLALYLEKAHETVLLDAMEYDRQGPDVSLSRLPDGTGPWQITDKPTPSRANELFFRTPVSNVYINEFHTTYDPAANEWIELYNDNNHPVDAGGLFLTTDLERKMLYRLPPNRPWQTTIAAHGFLVISNKDISRWNKLLLPFRLEPEEGEIGLAQLTPDKAVYLDYLFYGPQPQDGTTGRYPDGEGSWQGLATPTPGVSNLITAKEKISSGTAVSVYPNPSRGSFHIVMNDREEYPEKITVSIYTLTGRLLYRRTYTSQKRISLYMENTPQGIYLLKITGKGVSHFQKIEIL